MDAFGYNVAAVAPAFGYNVPNDENVRRDGWSPYRDELAELIRRLRVRYGRRRVFRVNDVVNVLNEMRNFNAPVERRLVFAPQTPAVIDLTSIDEVVE